MNYFYKIYSNSDLGKQLQRFVELCKSCVGKAEAFMTEFKADAYIESTYGFAGGVMALVYNDPDNIPEGWEALETPQRTGFTCLPTLPDEFLPSWINLDTDHVGDTKNVEYKDMVYDPEQRKYVEQLKTVAIVITESMLIARRMSLLPVVPVQMLLEILKPKQQLRSLSATPTFFEYRGAFYIQTTFECDLVPTDDFFKKRMAFMNVNT